MLATPHTTPGKPPRPGRTFARGNSSPPRKRRQRHLKTRPGPAPQSSMTPPGTTSASIEKSVRTRRERAILRCEPRNAPWCTRCSRLAPLTSRTCRAGKGTACCSASQAGSRSLASRPAVRDCCHRSRCGTPCPQGRSCNRPATQQIEFVSLELCRGTSTLPYSPATSPRSCPCTSRQRRGIASGYPLRERRKQNERGERFGSACWLRGLPRATKRTAERAVVAWLAARRGRH